MATSAFAPRCHTGKRVAFAVNERADHLVAMPDAITLGFGERMFMALFVPGVSR